MMRRTLSLLLVLSCMAVLLAGCGKEETSEDVTRLEMKKSGEVIHTIVEDFSQPYYDMEELTADIQSQVDEYNAKAGSEKITLKQAENEEGTVRVVMTFSKPEDYTGFYRQALFCGTVKEAFEAGYDLDVELNSAKADGGTINKQDILDMGERHIVVVREAVTVIPYAEILYASDDVTVSENRKEAVTSNGESLSYIIFK